SHPRREAGLVFHLVDNGKARGGVVLRHQQADRVGADVDGRDAVAGGRRVRRRSGLAGRPGDHAPVAAGCTPDARASPRSSAWCLMDLPSTRKTTSSPMLVARSATRSMFRLTRNSSMPAPIL